MERTSVLPDDELIPEPIATLIPPSIGMPFIRFGHFIMQRRQLLGIASRAESRQSTGSKTTRSEAA